VIRTPIYTDVTTAQEKNDLIKSMETNDGDARALTRDDVVTKIVKYVPGEVVAAFAAIFALGASVGQWALWVSFVFGLIGTPGYFAIGAKKLRKQDQPRVYFYVLSVPAFLIWRLAVSPQVRDLLHVGNNLSEWLLFAGAFSIPFVDEAFTATWPAITTRFKFLA